MGFEELLVIGIAILVLFGANKIPDMMKSLGSGVREFNDAKNNPGKDEKPKKPAPQPKPEPKTELENKPAE